MEKGKKIRNHPLTIFEGLLGMLWFVFVFGISFLGIFLSAGEDLELNPGTVIAIVFVGFILLIGLTLFLAYIRWRKCFVYIDGNEITLEKGVIFKRKTVIPFEKINTIDINRNIIQRIFGLCRLSVDTGSLVAKTASTPELSIVLKVAEAENLKAFISAKMKNEDAVLKLTGDIAIENSVSEKSFKTSFKDYLIYGISTSKIGWIIVVIFGFLGEFGETFFDFVFDTILPTLSRVNTTALIIAGIGLFVVLYIAVTIFSILLSFIRFYNFTVTRDNNNINIKYGLLTLKNFTLPVRNIHAVIVKQNFIRQIFGLCSVETVSIGYGDGENEVSLLFPIINKKKLAGLMNEFLPEYSVDAVTKKAPLRSLLWFIIKPLLVLGVLTAVAYYAVKLIFNVSVFGIPAVVAVLAVLVLLTLLSGIMRFCHTGIDYDEKSVRASGGGFFKTVTVIRRECVQSVEEDAGLIQRMLGISSYYFDYHAPAMKSKVAVKNLKSGYAKEITEIIEK